MCEVVWAYKWLVGYLNMNVCESDHTCVCVNKSSDFQTAHGVWAQEVTNATCVSVNHRYRLIAIGTKR